MTRSDKLLTGIDKLDTLLSGGLERRRGYLIRGDSGSGKTTVAMRMLYSALQRNEPCLFISYSNSFNDVIEHFENFGWGIEDYMERGLFKIIDLFSSTFESLVDAHSRVPKNLAKAVYFLRYDIDPDTYAEFRKIIRDALGWESVCVIDDLADRFRFVQPKEAIRQQSMMRAIFARYGKATGLHVYTPSTELEKQYSNYLRRIEDGTIELKKDKVGNNYLRLLLKRPPITTGFYKLIIEAGGLYLSEKEAPLEI